jgi:hypothetical protein
MGLTRARWGARVPRFLLAALVVTAIMSSAHRHAKGGPEDTKTSGSNAHKQSSPVRAGGSFNAHYQRPAIRWELLDFWDQYPSPARRAIKSVRLIEFKDSMNDPLSPKSPIKVKIDSDDPLVLQQTERGLCDSRRSVLSDLKPKGSAMDNVAWGTLRVTTTDGEFVIFVYRDGFAMDFVRDGNSAFSSWTLSRVLDDLYVHGTGRHLDQKMLEELSGESQMRSARQEYAEEHAYLKKITEYTAILDKDPKATKTYMDRADARRHVGQLDSAVEDYTRAIDLSPNDARVWCKRGIIYFLKTDNQRAIADFTKAIQLDPKFLDAYHWRAQVYTDIGDEAKADADLKVFDVFVEGSVKDEAAGTK